VHLQMAWITGSVDADVTAWQIVPGANSGDRKSSVDSRVQQSASDVVSADVTSKYCTVNLVDVCCRYGPLGNTAERCSVIWSTSHASPVEKDSHHG